MRKIINVLVILFAVALFFTVNSYTTKLMEWQLIEHKDCTLPPQVCPAYYIPTESTVGYVIIVALIILSLSDLFLSRKFEKAEKVAKVDIQQKVKTLTEDQKKLYDILAASGALFQSDLVEKSGMDKVKVTRELDKMEGFGIIERKRRGMSNMVVLKK